MKVELDLTDLYVEDSETDISSEILNAIKWRVSHELDMKLKDSISKVVNKSVDEIIKRIATSNVEEIIAEKINLRLNSIEISEQYNKNKSTTVEKWIIKQVEAINSESLNRLLTNKVNDATNKAIKDLQNQYNDKFAQAIITKLKESNFLSEKASMLLLDK